MEEVRGIDDGTRRRDLLSRASTDGLNRAEDLRVVFGVLPEREDELLGVFKIIREARAKLADRIGLVDAEDRGRVFDAKAQPIPCLSELIFGPQEDDALRRASCIRASCIIAAIIENERALGLIKTKEIIEIAILTIIVLDVAISDEDGGGGEDRHALSHRLKEARPARRVKAFLLLHAVKSSVSRGARPFRVEAAPRDRADQLTSFGMPRKRRLSVRVRRSGSRFSSRRRSAS